MYIVYKTSHNKVTTIAPKCLEIKVRRELRQSFFLQNIFIVLDDFYTTVNESQVFIEKICL